MASGFDEKFVDILKDIVLSVPKDNIFRLMAKISRDEDFDGDNMNGGWIRQRFERSNIEEVVPGSIKLFDTISWIDGIYISEDLVPYEIPKYTDSLYITPDKKNSCPIAMAF